MKSTDARGFAPAPSTPMNAPSCPMCGGPLRRIHRRFIDRVLSLFRPVRRYRCPQPTCRWEGNVPVRETQE
jgi:hypothetical protein